MPEGHQTKPGRYPRVKSAISKDIDAQFAAYDLAWSSGGVDKERGGFVVRLRERVSRTARRIWASRNGFRSGVRPRTGPD